MEPSLPPDPRQGARRLSRRCKYRVILNNYKEFPRLLRAEDAPFLHRRPGRFVSFQNIAAFGKTLKRDFFCRCDRKISCRRPTFLPLRRRRFFPLRKNPLVIPVRPLPPSVGPVFCVPGAPSICGASSAHRRGRARAEGERQVKKPPFRWPPVRNADCPRQARPACRVRMRRHVRDGRKAGTLTFGVLPIE